MPKLVLRHEDDEYTLETFSELDLIHLAIEKSGTFYEIDVLKWIKRLDRSGVYVDVGANIGNHTVWFATQCQSLEVFAMEGNPQILPLLKTNVANISSGHRKVTIVDRFISNQKEVEFFPAENENVGMASVRSVDETQEGHRNIYPTISLDEALSGVEHITFIKIDAEGHELEVIDSAITTLEKWKPDLLIESWDYPGQLAGTLRKMGYVLVYADNQHNFGFIFMGRFLAIVDSAVGKSPRFLRSQLQGIWRSIVFFIRRFSKQCGVRSSCCARSSMVSLGGVGI